MPSVRQAPKGKTAESYQHPEAGNELLVVKSLKEAGK